jgi:predicted outer membrane protein
MFAGPGVMRKLMSSSRKKRGPGKVAYGFPKATRLPRSFATLLVIVALMSTVTALVVPVVRSAGSYRSPGTADAVPGTVQTPTGPLTALDRDFVKRVRWAGLWEIPAGRMAVEKGGTPEVRTAGQHLIDGHTELDRAVLETAGTLGLDVPSVPSAQQQAWLKQLEGAQGDEFDRQFANIVRSAHGQVFAVVAQVRASTQNSTVRDLATLANSTVLDHMAVLEATRLVNFGDLSSPPATSPSPGATRR